VSRLGRGDQPPEILVAPPAPRSRELSARLAASEAPTVNTLGPRDEPALVWEEALGANVLDADGNRFIDLTAGFGAAAVGHRHPQVVAALAAQAARLVHGLGDVAAHPARIELAERLATLAPVDQPRVHFAVSGSDAVEVALKTALAATGRPGVLAFEPAYHGLSPGALAAGSRREFRAPFAPHLNPHVVRLPFAAPAAALAAALADGRIGAVIVEPVVGREGVLVPPPGWLATLAAATRAHGALLVADEIFTGFGRTGPLFAVERDGVRPDLLCCGKALGGGLPIAATIGRRELMEVWRRDGEALHTGTFLAHPLACAAALAALDLLASPAAAAARAELAERFAAAVAALTRGGAPLLAGRTIGALGALDFASPAAAMAFAGAARARGVLLLAGGAEHRTVQLVPPFVLTPAQLDAAFAVLAASLEEVAATHA
jgi:acetylornithine/succinyldiaminopimelate/putrescine aminotransferase